MADTVRVLFLGDVVGPLGREAVKYYLENHKKQDAIDFVILNGENATHGKGLSVAHYRELMSYGADCITNGNHFFNCKDALTRSEEYTYGIRPMNLDPDCPGKGTLLLEKDGVKLRVTNILGRTYLPMTQSNPFYSFDENYKEEDAIHIVDFHAEATGEKRAFAEHLDGRVTAVIGTHTHVQTNDAKLLAKGTFFLTDAGMNGQYDSCLGVIKDGPVMSTMTGFPRAYEVAKTGKKLINGVLLVIDKETKRVVSYSLVNEIVD